MGVGRIFSEWLRAFLVSLRLGPVSVTKEWDIKFQPKWISNETQTKMKLRMDFYFCVGPTCLILLFLGTPNCCAPKFFGRSNLVVGHLYFAMSIEILGNFRTNGQTDGRTDVHTEVFKELLRN